ncbi:MAG TPA: hypothetical protein DD740_00445 [Chryseobacterium sp.]|nr:hypothetical protein [Chryseobacterium sp.]
MKKLILLFALIWSAMSFGQFKVSGSSDDWKEVGNSRNQIFLYSKGDKAKIKYLEWNTAVRGNLFDPAGIYEFTFSIEPDTLDKLYNIIIDHFNSRKREVLTLEFPEGNMYLNFYSSLGFYGFNFQFDKTNQLSDKNSTEKRNSFGLDKKQTMKLFDKK